VVFKSTAMPDSRSALRNPCTVFPTFLSVVLHLLHVFLSTYLNSIRNFFVILPPGAGEGI